MPTSIATTNTVQLRIALPEEIAAKYQVQADSSNQTLEHVLSTRLASAVDHAAEKPIYFDDADRRELEQILGKNVFSTRDVLVQIRNAVSVRIQSVKVTLKPGLLSRLKTRCLGMKWEAFLEKTIVEDLERYAGMR